MEIINRYKIVHGLWFIMTITPECVLRIDEITASASGWKPDLINILYSILYGVDLITKSGRSATSGFQLQICISSVQTEFSVGFAHHSSYFGRSYNFCRTLTQTFTQSNFMFFCFALYEVRQEKAVRTKGTKSAKLVGLTWKFMKAACFGVITVIIL